MVTNPLKPHKSRKTTKRFVEESDLIYNGKYDYSKAIYIGNRNPICIICPIHKDFWQSPTNHLRGHGCPKCSATRKSLKFGNFIEKAIKKHSGFYDYSKVSYINSNTPVTISCPNHGDFQIKPNSHLMGSGCRDCWRQKMSDNNTKDINWFIGKANLVHNNKYDYSKTDYIHSREKVTITCSEHGDFLQTAAAHLSGKGCRKCSDCFFTFKKEEWKKKSKGKEAILYILKCWNEEENFYKIGITFNSVKKRYSSKKSMPYKYEIMKVIKSKDLGYIWDLEYFLKKKLKNLKYAPLIKFNGSKEECFLNLDVNNVELYAEI